MDKLKEVIEQYGRWNRLSEFIDRIEAHITSDFSTVLENAKSLLETIGKEICKSNGIELEPTASINSVLKKAFKGIGYSSNDLVTQVSSALTTIGQKMGELRNEIGLTAHGMSLQKLEERNNKVDDLTKEFLIDSTVIVACLLIRSFESKKPPISITDDAKMLLSEQEEFNNFWDETYGDFSMGDYSYSASEILFYVDNSAYITECKAYISGEERNEG